MVTLGITSWFLQYHNVQERRDASTNTDEHRPRPIALVRHLARPYDRLGTSQPHRVSRVTSSVVCQPLRLHGFLGVQDLDTPWTRT